MAEPRREPVLRLMPGPADINANGHIFGGWVLSQMDKAGGIIARHHSRGPVATIAIDRMEFIAPIHLRDLISVYAEIESIGRTSMKVRVDVMAWRDSGAIRIKVTEGLFTFVAIDDEARPRAVPAERSPIVGRES
jgi:acyl-CoA thioesterase YciA